MVVHWWMLGHIILDDVDLNVSTPTPFSIRVDASIWMGCVCNSCKAFSFMNEWSMLVILHPQLKYEEVCKETICNSCYIIVCSIESHWRINLINN